MKKRIVLSVAVTLVVVVILSGSITVLSDCKKEVNVERTNRTFSNLSYLNWNKTDESNSISIPFSCVSVNGVRCDKPDGIVVNKSDLLTVFIPKNGYSSYCLGFCYKIPDAFNTDCLFDVDYKSEKAVGFLPKIWMDEDVPYLTDKNGNEIASSQTGVNNFVNGFLCDYSAPGKNEIIFKDNDISVNLISQYDSIEISRIFIYNVSEKTSYSSYLSNSQYEQNEKNNSEIIIEAEEYSIKSAACVHATNLNSNKAYPYNTYKKLINILSGSYWNAPSQKVLWEFNAEKSGWYKLGFRYTIGGENEKSSYRTVEIDGKILFEEMKNVAFKSTGSEYDFNNHILSDKNGKPYEIYLEKGKHTIALKTTVGRLADEYGELSDVMAGLNDIGLELQRLTAGNTDPNRTWDLELYMPDVIEKIEALKSRIKSSYNRLCDLEGTSAGYADNLIYATEQLDKLLKNKRTIPNNIELLNVGDDSASKYVGTILSKLVSQPLTLDRIYFTQKDGKTESGYSAVHSMWDSLCRFCYSYIPKNDGVDTSKPTVEVWVNRSMQYSQMISQMVEADNGDLKNLNIDISVMQNAQKLVLANASANNPDVVISLDTATPYNLAIRGAAKNFCDYKDFLDFYSKDYSLENLVPCSFNGGVYGLAETVDCKLLYYRKDILKKLGIDVPNTWDDVKTMMPTLLGNSYNFYIPLASSAGMKGYDVTSPFVYQNGGSYFTADGLSANLNNAGTVSGFKEMTDIFNTYSLQKVVPNFYNSFRYGEIPIGISGLGTYIQLTVAAPELNGLWDVALTPGTVGADGTVKRYQPAAGSMTMVFNNTDVPDEAWTFVKWWLSEKTQYSYAENMEQMYGTSYRYNTANLLAFCELEYPQEHKALILEQLSYQKETALHPASYMAEREVSNIWNSVAVDGKNLQEEINLCEIRINREIKRKMTEFGFLDDKGNVIKEYKTDTVDELRRKIIGRGEENS